MLLPNLNKLITNFKSNGWEMAVPRGEEKLSFRSLTTLNKQEDIESIEDLTQGREDKT
ncbi:MAG: hypothetical protein ACLFUU_11785 [Desulfobacteraceae bacterium]